MSKRSDDFSPRTVGCFGLFFGLLVLGMGYLLASIMLLEPLMRKREAEAWVSNPCVIREISDERHTLKSDSGRRRRSSSTSLAYSPKVLFEYRYDGADFSGTRFWFSHRYLNTQEEVAELISSYKIGDETVCWVNPKDPSDAVINRDNPGVSIVGGLFG
jgi:hypothetical protein